MSVSLRGDFFLPFQTKVSTETEGLTVKEQIMLPSVFQAGGTSSQACTKRKKEGLELLGFIGDVILPIHLSQNLLCSIKLIKIRKAVREAVDGRGR